MCKDYLFRQYMTTIGEQSSSNKKPINGRQNISLSNAHFGLIHFEYTMNISIKLTRPHTTYTSREIIHGTIILHCLHPTTLSKVDIALVGETKSTLTDTSGLLIRRKNEETHRVRYNPPLSILNTDFNSFSLFVAEKT